MEIFRVLGANRLEKMFSCRAFAELGGVRAMRTAFEATTERLSSPLAAGVS